jgi:hypothetical protein
LAAAAFCWKRWILCGSICGALIAGRSPWLLGQMSRSTCRSDENGILLWVAWRHTFLTTKSCPHVLLYKNKCSKLPVLQLIAPASIVTMQWSWRAAALKCCRNQNQQDTGLVALTLVQWSRQSKLYHSKPQQQFELCLSLLRAIF